MMDWYAVLLAFRACQRPSCDRTTTRMLGAELNEVLGQPKTPYARACRIRRIRRSPPRNVNGAPRRYRCVAVLLVY